MSNPSLIARRKAAAAMNALVVELQLGSLAVRFDGDQDSEWSVHNSEHLIAIKDGQRVADIQLHDNEVTIEIEDAYLLIRHNHLKEFNPYEFGINICRELDFKGDKVRPDLCANFDQPPVLGLNLPKQPMERTIMSRNAKVIRALS
jgi:hypothetical protein